MGHFDETICDCCVCPMQCVLEQLVGQEDIGIVTPSDDFFLQIEEVKNFIVSGIEVSGEKIHFPICKIVAVCPQNQTFSFDLKPIQTSTKGECACCEDPITNLAKSLKDQVSISIDTTEGDFEIVTGIISDVGEGIVILQQESSNVAISSCAITRISEIE
ncbi:hypothetical protein VQL36_16205 [Chengkuizengella sp. SCS-71B]|uniref:hypothetical protein n=1 Tax=Chengkuizengella sp. SCS-71B TaxID=3115290 RepID=UPI0032C226E7